MVLLLLVALPSAVRSGFSFLPYGQQAPLLPGYAVCAPYLTACQADYACAGCLKAGQATNARPTNSSSCTAIYDYITQTFTAQCRALVLLEKLLGCYQGACGVSCHLSFCSSPLY